MQQTTRLFLIIALVISINSDAQFLKGTRMVGATIGTGFFNSGNSEQTVTSIGTVTAKVTGYGVNLTPSIGWFLSENMAVGVNFVINPSSDKITFEENGSTFQKDNSSSFNVGLGGFVRNYFSKSGSFLPFGQLGFDAGITSRKIDGFFYGGSGTLIYKDTYSGKSSGGFFGDFILALGVTKMLGENTGLDLQLGYNYSYNKNTIKTTTFRDDGVNGSIDETRPKETATKFTNHRFTIGIGFQVFLEKKKN